MNSSSVNTLVLDTSFSKSVEKAHKLLDDLWNSGSVLVRLSDTDWSSCPAEAAETLDRDTPVARVSPESADAVDHVLGDMNLRTDIVLMRLPERGYAIRIFEIECQLETLYRAPEAAEYVMNRMSAVRKTRDGADAALHRRLSSRRVFEVNYGALKMMRGVNLPADFRADVDRVTERIEAALEDK